LKEFSSIFECNSDEINQIVISPDGKFMAVCDDSGTIQVINLATKGIQRSLQNGHTNICSSIMFTPSKKVVSGGLDCQIIEWDWNKSPTKPLKFHSFSTNDIIVSTSSPGLNPPHVHCVDVSIDGQYVAAAVGSGHVVVCNLPEKSRIGSVESHLAAVSQVRFPKFAPTNYLVSSGNDSKIIIYKTAFNEKKENPTPGRKRGGGGRNASRKGGRTHNRRQGLRAQPNPITEEPVKIERSFVHHEKVNWIETNYSASDNLFVADLGNQITIYSIH